MTERKASEVLVEIEEKLNLLITTVQAQDFTLKVLSAKLNRLITGEAAPNKNPVGRIEAVDTVSQQQPKQNVVLARDKLPEEKAPEGFRRTSRADTYSTETVFTDVPQQARSKEAEIVLDKQDKKKTSKVTIPVLQKVVNANGKPAFMAEVELFDSNNNQVFKTRVNAAGNWMASLNFGLYRANIKHKEPVTSQIVEIDQDIDIKPGMKDMTLPVLILNYQKKA